MLLIEKPNRIDICNKIYGKILKTANNSARCPFTFSDLSKSYYDFRKIYSKCKKGYKLIAPIEKVSI